MIRRIVLAAFCGMFLFNLNAVAEWGGGSTSGGGAGGSWGDDGVNCNNYARALGITMQKNALEYILIAVA